VGSLVRQAEEQRIELDQLPVSAFSAAHSAFGADVLEALAAQASVDRRSVPGGTAPSAVREQLELARASLRPADALRANTVSFAG
jgi:argininosuccinate lyase